MQEKIKTENYIDKELKSESDSDSDSDNYSDNDSDIDNEEEIWKCKSDSNNNKYILTQ